MTENNYEAVIRLLIKKIDETSSSPSIFLREMLSARGFLLDYIPEKKSNFFVLSDNSHPDDKIFLEDILGRLKLINNVNSNQLVNNYPYSLESLSIIFKHGGGEAGSFGGGLLYQTSWKYFRRRRHGFKAPLYDLDPFIARLVKSSCLCAGKLLASCPLSNPVWHQIR